MVAKGPELNQTSTIIRRSPSDAESDATQTFRNLADGLLAEWPNEAGFEGLTEERGPFQLNVTGYIPGWTAGSLYRIGPGVYEVDLNDKEPFRVQHWFDGLGHAHRFEIVTSTDEKQSAKVFYTSRRQCDDFVKSLRNGGTRFFSFAQKSDPCIGLFGKVASFFQKRNTGKTIQVTINPNIPVYPKTLTDSHKPAPIDSVTGHHANVKSLWLATDSTPLIQVDPVTLEPGPRYVTPTTINPDYVGHSSCAHFNVDPITGDYFNFNLRFGPVPSYMVYQLPQGSKEMKVLATIQECNVPAAYIHSAFISPSYFVLCVPSTHLSTGGLMMLWNYNMHDTIKSFNESMKTKWFVIDRHNGKGVVARFETPAGFFFHSTNSFEDAESGKLYCEMLEYPNTDIIHSFYCDIILNRDGRGVEYWREFARKDHNQEILRRYEFDMAAAIKLPSGELGPTPYCVVEIPGPHVGELPTINPAFATRKHRYVFSNVSRGLSTMFDGIAKTDTEMGGALIWSGAPGHTPGEPVFVARPGAMEEDDGVLLSVVLDGNNRTSYLLCLDAGTLKELGRADCNFAVGIGFHGHHAKATY